MLKIELFDGIYARGGFVGIYIPENHDNGRYDSTPVWCGLVRHEGTREDALQVVELARRRMSGEATLFTREGKMVGIWKPAVVTLTGEDGMELRFEKLAHFDFEREKWVIDEKEEDLRYEVEERGGTEG